MESVCCTEVLRLGQPWGSPSFMAVFSSADDHSRVRLQMLDGDNNSDYINGNYIDVCILQLPTNPGFRSHTTPRLRRAVSRCVSAASTSKRQSYPTLHKCSLFGEKRISPSLYPFCLMCTKELFLHFCQQLKDVCILMGQSRLIPNAVICRRLSAPVLLSRLQSHPQLFTRTSKAGKACH